MQAAGTDAWHEFRQAVGRWFGRGHDERKMLERLDQTASALKAVDSTEIERLRIREQAAWQARIEDLFEDLTEAERNTAASQLRALLAEHAPQHAEASAGAGGLAVGGKVDIRADKGSIAAGVIHGGANVGTPTTPDPSQG